MPFDAKPPHFWPAAEGFVPDCVLAQSEKVMAEFSRICSDHSQKKTHFGESELKMQPKLSTGYSYATQLNKV